MRRGATRLATAMLICGIAAVVGSFLGRWHPLGDSLAVFRTAFSIGLATVAFVLLILNARRAAVLGVVVAGISLVSLFPHWISGAFQAEAASQYVTVYQKNLWFGLDAVDPLVADIRASGADIVTLQEVSRTSRSVVEALSDDYPVRIDCFFASVGGVAILSRYPERVGTRSCSGGSGMLEVELDTENGPLRVITLHLHWPWPFGQNEQIEELVPSLQADAIPTIVGGDFNMVRWSSALRHIASETGTEPVGPSRITLRNKRGVLSLPIDHVLATEGRGTNELRPTLGSDHNGLLARVQMPVAHGDTVGSVRD